MLPAFSIGEKFHELRDQYVTLSQEIEALERATMAPHLPAPMELSALSQPIRIIAFGSAYVGKSSLINALVEKEIFSTTNYDHSLELRIHRDHTGPYSQFEWIDTPNCEIFDSNLQENFITKANESDVILAVFSINNPWCPSTWNLLQKIQRQSLQQVLIILQQSNLKSAADIEMIRTFVNELSMKQLNLELPTFPVSTEHGIESRKMDSSRFKPIDHAISNLIDHAPHRLALLHQYLGYCSDQLKSVTYHIEESKTNFNQRQRQLRGIEQDIDKLYESAKNSTHHTADSISVQLKNQSQTITKTLTQELGYLKSVFRLIRPSSLTEIIQNLFSKHLMQHMNPIIESFSSELRAITINQWKDISLTIQNELRIPFISVADLDNSLKLSVQNFNNELIKYTQKFINQINIQPQLEFIESKSQSTLFAYHFLISLLLIATSLTGYFGSNHRLALIFLILAGILVFLSIIVHFKFSKNLVQQFENQRQHLCSKLSSHLQPELINQVFVFFSQYSKALETTQLALKSEQESANPIAVRCEELYLTLNTHKRNLRDSF